MRRLVTGLLGTAFALLVAAAPADATQRCDVVASPAGRDGAPGTAAAPLRTVQQVADRLGPGVTGCLRAGSYRAEETEVSRGGSARGRAVLRSWPGELATVHGRMVVADSADYVTLTELRLDGRNRRRLPSPSVAGDSFELSRSDVTNHHTSICLSLGHQDYGYALAPVIASNRIHDCGELPATNHHHGIYAEAVRSAVIRGNWVYGNADRGVQFYPDADSTVMSGNVVHANGSGVIFGAEAGAVSDGNVVERNVISGSALRANVESYYPAGQRRGRGNRVAGNCVASRASWWGALGGIDLSARGFAARANKTVASPGFRDVRAGDLRLRADSQCRAVLGRWVDAVPGPRALARAVKRRR